MLTAREAIIKMNSRGISTHTRHDSLQYNQCGCIYTTYMMELDDAELFIACTIAPLMPYCALLWVAFHVYIYMRDTIGDILLTQKRHTPP